MNNTNEEITLKIKPRPSENISISIPKDTLKSLQTIADNQDMSIEALLKFYIGKGLRQDLAKLSSNSEVVIHHS
ncbi:MULTISPECIES: hypothetical protein [Crocosphaera]|uniref:Ribbon-helix-helix protein CopG domain-containing protein n=3 Tax=Crocosphaera watsonii TaxID=263511 RepID=T2K0X7_CROWT|nr:MULTISPECIES: hypothetical protein [Crocosphaera]EHJ12840.1 hypothetical protein CWATWH0003_2466 [Crocosphaera watsonii WH 0003]NQZ64158.1 hypothetical protein [Crocosphaera sp.]CCQ58390.1 hypothetical protein CWATWH0005_2721 [Crocosphaera watsonii WH 0005]CCQ70952.1 hypothetical protein CWATWH0402_5939 [Crocosphaera watsonii WH 0402]